MNSPLSTIFSHHQKLLHTFLVFGVVFFSVNIFFTHKSVAQTNSITVLNPTVKTGDAVIITLPFQQEDIKEVKLDSKPFTLFTYQEKMMGIVPIAGREAKGSRRITLTTTGNKTYIQKIDVKARAAPSINLPVPKKMNVTSEKLVQNIEAQKAEIQNTVVTGSVELLVSKPFGLPLADNRRVTSPYGEIRKTGDETIRHLGTDFGGALGSIVYAINDGTVLSAYLDPVYGKTVIIDHGAGISSLYMHLNSISVTKGQKLKQGAKVGTLGQTGLASAPHLHLSIKVAGESIDPLSFIRNFK